MTVSATPGSASARPEHRTPRRQPRQGRDRTARARLRPHARQRAASRAAVLDPRLRHHGSRDRRRAARVHHRRRPAGRRARSPAEPQGRRHPHAHRGAHHPDPAGQGPGRRHRRRHQDRPQRRDPESRARDLHADQGHGAEHAPEDRARLRLPAGHRASPSGRRDPHHRSPDAGRELLARSVASPTPWKPRASSSAPTSTSWCWTSRPTARSTPRMRSAPRPTS